ncbi:MAG: ABC transporter substrate-binding protein [Elainellaceae cyanobacterium]
MPFYRIRLIQRWLICLILPIVLVGLLGGCRLSIPKTAAADESQLVLTSLSDPKTFNAALRQQFPNIFLFCFRGLTEENGVTGAIEPSLAESWEFSNDQQRVIFTLREGLRWSDGEPLSADDVVFTYQDIVFNKAIPTDAKDAFRIGEQRLFPQVRKRGDRQIEFILPEPFAPLLRAVAGPNGVNILPQHVLQDAVNTLDADGNPVFISTWGTDTDPAQIIVNGPYKMERYVPAQRLIFRRNPHYWKQDSQGRQLPYVDRIIWQFLESDDTQLLRFRSGELDALGDAGALRPEDFSLLKREEERGDFTIQIGGPRSSTLFLSFNLNQGKNENGQPLVDPVKSRWFNTLEFRQAVAYAIDRPRLINNIFRGIGDLQHSPISVQSPYYLSPDEGLPVYDYSIDKAKNLLISAGFQYDLTGRLLDADNNPVEFVLNTNSGNEVREGVGSQIKSNLADIGIRVNFNPISFNTLVSNITTTREWEGLLIGFTGGVEPHDSANLWMSTGGSHLFNLGPQPGKPAITEWGVNEWEQDIDQLFKQGARELDEAKRKIIYADFQRIVQDQLPVIHLVNGLAMMASRDRLQGLKYSGLPSWGLWNIEEIKVDEGMGVGE